MKSTAGWWSFAEKAHETRRPRVLRTYQENGVTVTVYEPAAAEDALSATDHIALTSETPA